MAEAVHSLKNGAADGESTAAQMPFPVNLADVQERSTAALARTNEAMLRAAQTIWQSQSELLRLEAEQAAKALMPPKLDGNPSAALSGYYDQWRDGSEKLIQQMRTVNDAVRECGWQLFGIYADSLRPAAGKPAAAPGRKA